MEITVGAFDFDKITIKDLSGKEVTYDLTEELRVNEFNVVKEFLVQSSKYVYWGSVLEKVKMYRESTELRAETYKASIYEPSRLKLVEAGVNKPTKEQVQAQIMLDQDYIKIMEEYTTYNYLVGQLTYVVKAFEQRKDMLIQYGAEQRRMKEYERNIQYNPNIN